ncbi:hypothetical protein DPMN_174150 [Dreissena polymorpha]|uniref:Uncharacterized protein n=1 Tax=Dreissena polymorpha TaxID=45954 RepID=A0A9D4IIB5_DREPO|nr:hypothetical protein DPMN_174150 [Dreissena polymorpha]
MYCTQWSFCIVQVNIYITENTGHVVYTVEYLLGTSRRLHYSEHRPCDVDSGVPA